MGFKKICISGVSYGDNKELEQYPLNNKLKITNVDFLDKNFFDDLNNQSSP